MVVPADEVPGGDAVLHPFLVVDDAAGLIDFVSEVFGVTETEAARTPMPDGTLIHAELRFGTVNLQVADRQEGWPSWPALLAVWVCDSDEILRRAAARGAAVITQPTPFYGEITLARLRDPWGNLWWLYQPAPGQPDPVPTWEGGSSEVFDTIDAAMRAAKVGS